MVVTDSPAVAAQTNAHFGQYSLLVEDLSDPEDLVRQAQSLAAQLKLWGSAGAVLVLSGKYEANADMQPQLHVHEMDTRRELRRSFSTYA